MKLCRKIVDLKHICGFPEVGLHEDIQGLAHDESPYYWFDRFEMLIQSPKCKFMEFPDRMQVPVLDSCDGYGSDFMINMLFHC